MAKKKLREWEIPMNLSNQERVLYKMTVVDQVNNSAKNEVTINKADYSQATGKVVKVSEQKIMLDLTKGVKGVETNVWLTIQDENGTEHTGTLFMN